MPTDSPKITAKEAAQIASNYFVEVTSYTGGTRLEEIEYSQSEGVWKITLSHQEVGNPYSALYGNKMDYKIFRIHGETGDVLSMKIRTVNE